MSIVSYLSVFLLFAFSLGCQNNSGEQSGSEMAVQSDGPQLKKITIQSKQQADSLLAAGIDVIVVEDDYVVARLDEANEEQVQSMHLQTKPIEESDLVQRLVKIVIKDRLDSTALLEMGVDIWEIKGDTVIAQVFDKHIRLAQEKGYPVEIVERNVLDTVKVSKK